MEETVLPLPEVARALEAFIPVQLHTDGLDDKSKFNAKLQREKFGTVAIPLYVIVSPDGKELARLEGLERDPRLVIAFLQRGTAGSKVAQASSQ